MTVGQGFVGGGRLFLGGLEAAHLACGGNPGLIDMLVDCRGDSTTGRRGGHDVLRIPSGLRAMKMPTNRLGKPRFASEAERGFEPLIGALAAGMSVLVFVGVQRFRISE